jgi:hypothetical protein
MPFNVNRGPAVIIEKEILRGAAGLDDIKSMVVDSTTVAQNPSGSGRYILEAGTVMCKINGSSKIAPITATPNGTGSSGAWAAADIVGILATTHEFYLGPGITAGTATDEPVAILHAAGLRFNISQLVGYTGNETMVKTAMPLCKFE